MFPKLLQVQNCFDFSCIKLTIVPLYEKNIYEISILKVTQGCSLLRLVIEGFYEYCSGLQNLLNAILISFLVEN